MMKNESLVPTIVDALRDALLTPTSAKRHDPGTIVVDAPLHLATVARQIAKALPALHLLEKSLTSIDAAGISQEQLDRSAVEEMARVMLRDGAVTRVSNPGEDPGTTEHTYSVSVVRP
jgi:hypothetical protein